MPPTPASAPLSPSLPALPGLHSPTSPSWPTTHTPTSPRPRPTPVLSYSVTQSPELEPCCGNPLGTNRGHACCPARLPGGVWVCRFCTGIQRPPDQRQGSLSLPLSPTSDCFGLPLPPSRRGSDESK
ncbi:hypothetical protein CC85DRAFT_303420 [Cutaneotrichosporon oleaginosum]|uniref:Uncharacterized protein n=1 Tax=Cutaneotrichosporon oleaginosum TaxID=879819 RepID=A0A0J1B0T7_9TREE|nr:uncharacterized protein CC85DRAFT_303420 [Cutaneotrichosporon oleaginosum]KLT41224.1 hypothetical protein CC85DRAFT_303420 [Cutaneotrichosporon oleaginosum]TXT05489.1 hypothetical protein COLE_06809 [Cutaneotrichosporon oleaginosum]